MPQQLVPLLIANPASATLSLFRRECEQPRREQLDRFLLQWRQCSAAVAALLGALRPCG